MTRPTLYLETTVIGHITARPQSDITVAARQLASRSWWDSREVYELFISQIVLDECNAGDPIAASERVALIRDVAMLDISPEAELLAQQLTNLQGIPDTEPRDALHVAIAAASGIQYLLTWNFRHIANPSTRKLIERICEDAGYVPPVICSPDEILRT